MSCGKHKHPLHRSGTNQKQRFSDALKDNYVEIDEKNFADWIVFAADFSAYLKYYNNSNQYVNTWKPFFENDISAILGLVAIQDISRYRDLIKSKFDNLRTDDHKNNTTLLTESFAYLFSYLVSLSSALDHLILRLPDDPPLKSVINNIIQVKLRPGLYRLLAYYKTADVHNLLTEKDSGFKILNEPVRKAKSIITEGLSKGWIYAKDPGVSPAPDWNTYYSNITPDNSIYGSPGNTFKMINHAVNHNLFAGIFDQYLTAYAKIIKSAEAGLIITLSKWNTHPPHYALFLSFLRLYKTAQASINTIKKRHLDFYYREVLRLKPGEAQPNHAHVVIELAKHIDDYMLKKGAEFKAGKDSQKKEVFYILDKDTVFNKAKSAKFMAVYVGNSKDNIVPSLNDKRVFAAPVINSANGLGAKLKTPREEWHPFVNKTFVEGSLSSIDIPEAQIGFAVASHYLFLTEGERKVFLKLATSDNNKVSDLSVDCFLTTEKGWYKIESIQKTIDTITDGTPCVIISFTLQGTEPPITNYNPALHAGVFNCNLPMLKIYLKQDDAQTYQYDSLKDITLDKIEIEVKVGEISGYTDTGLKQLMLATDNGPIDGSKPFQPFGPDPQKGSSLIVGSKELFSKMNSQFKLNIEWKNLPDDPANIDYDVPYTPSYYPRVTFGFLYGGKWNEYPFYTDIFDLVNAKVSTIWQMLPDEIITDYLRDYVGYNITSSNGFFKFSLERDFGLKGYRDNLIKYLIAESKTPGSGTKPIEPYTPVIQSVYLSYIAYSLENLTAADKIAFENRSLRFFHIYPFGETEQHKQITGESSIYLLPQFKHEGYNEESKLNEIHPGIGEFYIGFENLKPGQSFSVLFQLLEGSTDPLIQKPEEHVRWSYLSNNKWIAFKSSSVSDHTRQLIQSGIIEFAIPEDSTTENSLLPSGYIWLRAAISEAPDAISKILAILPQAAVVTFKSNDNADDFLNDPLPAATISKLKEPATSIKKIEQPYSSFGGLPREADAHFYIRVSERLRHKNRAVTIWDYERIVLEAFPQIHKVKCISHTKLVPDESKPGEKIYSELAPGYVTIITIPDLKNRNDTDPLKPFTNTDLLVSIRDYLKSKTTCHAKIITENPLFEELRMEFNMKLMKGYNDKVFYKKLLQQEITQFLTPWAFDSNIDVQFGGKIYKSVLIDFIEERPYVDFITDVKLYHTIEQVESGDVDEAVGSTERSVLVSAPASHHDITVLPDEGDLIPNDKCENYEPVADLI